MKTARLILWTLFLLTHCLTGFTMGNADGDSLRIKSITGYAYDADFDSVVIVVFKHYDQAGRLIETGEPRMYCGITWTYDDLGRIAVEEVWCGESSGNGPYEYFYTDTSVCINFSGPTSNYYNCDYYDSHGLKTHGNFTHIGLDYFNDNDTLYGFVEYSQTYNSRNLPEVYKERKLSFYYDYKEGNSDTTISESTTLFYYNGQDSVISKIVLNEAGEIFERAVYRYDPVSHRKTDEYHFGRDMLSGYDTAAEAAVSGYRHVVYEYDGAGSLTGMGVYNYCDVAAEKETWTEWVDFKNNLPTGHFFFDACTGVCTQTIEFKYEFW